LNKARTETKNWVRSARLRNARMDPDVRLGIFSFKSTRRWSKNDHRARKPRRPHRQSRAQVAFSCGQPVQNLCLDWAQYIEFAAIGT
jgi:hypothetical protein